MNSGIINTLIEYPSIILHLLIEHFFYALLAYYVVWAAIRPKDGTTLGNIFVWHAYGLAATTFGSLMFRVTAMATFAGHSAYEPSAEDGALALYILFVPALVATGYITLLKLHCVPEYAVKPQIQSNQKSEFSGINLFRCRTEATRRISNILFGVILLTWFTLVGIVSDGFSSLQPVGWFIVFGAPICIYILLLIILPIVRNSPKDIRFMISISLIWIFMIGIWGYILQWVDYLSSDRYLALFTLPPISIWLVFFLWKWSKTG